MGTRIPNDTIYDIQQRLYRIELKAGNNAVQGANLEKTLKLFKKQQERMLLIILVTLAMVIKDDILLFFG
tara:strand:- start:319 stop:528 length:210 start_codon:yes stop_codon:yes gene_type:complete